VLPRGDKKLGRRQQAIEAFKRAIRIKPDYAMAHLGLGEAYLELNSQDRILEEYKILQKLDPEWASKLFKLIYP
jgi:tetratricopeptide (TPR) repeat protein